jgi:hypothetical protein
MSPRPACRVSPVGADEKSSLNWAARRAGKEAFKELLNKLFN